MKIRKCVKCKEYTLKKIHCNIESVSAHPPRFKEKFLKMREKYGKNHNR